MSLVGPEGWSALRDLTDDERADMANPGRCECCRRHIEGEPVTDEAGNFCSDQCRIDYLTDEKTVDAPAFTWERAIAVIKDGLR